MGNVQAKRRQNNNPDHARHRALGATRVGDSVSNLHAVNAGAVTRMSFRQLKIQIKQDILKLASFILACQEIEFGRIEFVVHSGKVVQMNIAITERDGGGANPVKANPTS